MATDNNETTRLLAIKAALTSTTATLGFVYIKQMADNLVSKSVEEALEEEDREKRDGKIVRAAALRRGFADLWSAVESAKAIDPQADFGSGFEQLEHDEVEDARANN